MEFFWNNLAGIFAVGHEVSDEELLKIRRSTVGHQNVKFQVGFLMMESDGERREVLQLCCVSFA